MSQDTLGENWMIYEAVALICTKHIEENHVQKQGVEACPQSKCIASKKIQFPQHYGRS